MPPICPPVAGGAGLRAGHLLDALKAAAGHGVGHFPAAGHHQGTAGAPSSPEDQGPGAHTQCLRHCTVYVHVDPEQNSCPTKGKGKVYILHQKCEVSLFPVNLKDLPLLFIGLFFYFADATPWPPLAVNAVVLTGGDGEMMLPNVIFLIFNNI